MERLLVTVRKVNIEHFKGKVKRPGGEWVVVTGDLFSQSKIDF